MFKGVKNKIYARVFYFRISKSTGLKKNGGGRNFCSYNKSVEFFKK